MKDDICCIKTGAYMVGGERNRKKRILLLMREYVLGGAETQLRFLIEFALLH